MAIGSGLAAQLVASKETTYGTRVVPANAFEFGSEGLSLDKTYIQSRQLRAGRAFPSSSRRTATVKTAGGAISMEVPNKGFGFWLDLLHGNTVTPAQQGVTTAYLQTHNIGNADDAGKSATVQVGRPDSGGTVRAFDYLGCMVTQWQLACEVGGFLTTELTIDGRDEQTSNALVTPAYPAGMEGFNFTQGSVTIGGTAVANVNSFTLTGGLPRKVDRHFFGSSGVKNKPIQNDYAGVDANLSVEFTDLVAYNRYINGDIAAVVLLFEGDTIASTYKYLLRVTLSAAVFDGETPNVGGPDVLSHSLPTIALDNGTDPPVKIEYQSTDVTI